MAHVESDDTYHAHDENHDDDNDDDDDERFMTTGGIMHDLTLLFYRSWSTRPDDLRSVGRF